MYVGRADFLHQLKEKTMADVETKTFKPEFERRHMTKGIEVTINNFYGNLSVQVDGSYPYDQTGWESVAYIPETAAMVILTGEVFPSCHCNWFLNKGYVFYAEDYKHKYAIYNHDGAFSIIRREID
jgi:hypothetical protein